MSTTSIDWRANAECRDKPVDWFFDCCDVDELGHRILEERGLALCRSFCGQCSVRFECFEAAMAEEHRVPEMYRFGVRGGLTPQQRASLAKRGEDSWSCPDCGQVYDPIQLMSGLQVCGCSSRVAAPVSDAGDQWADRHTKLAKRVIAWVKSFADGSPVPSPTSYARERGIRKDDCTRVWRALVEDGVLVQVGRGQYRKNPGSHALKKRAGVVRRH